MPYFKCSLLFEVGKNGWSETWYRDSIDSLQAMSFTQFLGNRRARLLGLGASIIACRVSNVNDDRDSTLNAERIPPQPPGSTGGTADAAWNSYLVRTEAGDSHRKSWFTRGNPDEWINHAGLAPPFPVNVALTIEMEKFTKHLIAEAWRIRASAGSSETTEWNITAVDANVLLTRLTIVGHTLAVGNTVHIRKAKLFGASGKLLNGNWYVVAVTDATVTIQRTWDDITYIGSGKARKVETIYPLVSGQTVVRVGKRDTGRPFFLTRGRRGKARATS